jgi:hypothetical protein
MKKRKVYLSPLCEAIDIQMGNRLMTGSPGDPEGDIHKFVFGGDPWEDLLV